MGQALLSGVAEVKTTWQLKEKQVASFKLEPQGQRQAYESKTQKVPFILRLNCS